MWIFRGYFLQCVKVNGHPWNPAPLQRDLLVHSEGAHCKKNWRTHRLIKNVTCFYLFYLIDLIIIFKIDQEYIVFVSVSFLVFFTLLHRFKREILVQQETSKISTRREKKKLAVF